MAAQKAINEMQNARLEKLRSIEKPAPDDIVITLREGARIARDSDGLKGIPTAMELAADEIESLRRRVALLEDNIPTNVE